jgi:hypothetical protein
MVAVSPRAEHDALLYIRPVSSYWDLSCLPGVFPGRVSRMFNRRQYTLSVYTCMLLHELSFADYEGITELGEEIRLEHICLPTALVSSSTDTLLVFDYCCYYYYMFYCSFALNLSDITSSFVSSPCS